LSEESFVRSLSADDVADIRPLEEEGTIWAVLVAGSSGWFNYRHQAGKPARQYAEKFMDNALRLMFATPGTH